MTPKQTFINFPEFANNGTKTKPDDAKYAQGFLPADVLPAEWTNYFFHGSTKGVTDLNAGVTSIEDELINILTAAGIEPATATKNQIVSAIQTLITNKTGTLTNLTTAAKNNLVAALNEVKGGLGTAAAKNVDTEIGATAGENLPTSAAVTLQLNTKLTKYDLKEGFCVCSSDASAEVKELTIPEFVGVNLANGSKITVVMTNGNTYGTCVGSTSNKITEAQAVKFSINGGASYPVKVGGEYAGEGFMNAGDCHLFVFDGTAWNDLTADVIYQGSTSNGNYTKKRNGFIEQWETNTNGIWDADKIIKYNINFTSNPIVIINGMQSSPTTTNCHYSEKIKSITTSQFTYRGYNSDGVTWIAIGY